MAAVVMVMAMVQVVQGVQVPPAPLARLMAAKCHALKSNQRPPVPPKPPLQEPSAALNDASLLLLSTEMPLMPLRPRSVLSCNRGVQYVLCRTFTC